MKKCVILLISWTMVVSCNVTCHNNVVESFQKELESFLKASNTRENAGKYCLILFKTVPDSTVSFISSEHPHILIDEQWESKYKVFAKDGDTLIVSSPKDFRFEHMFQGWQAVDEIVFLDCGPRFDYRVDYVIKGNQLRMIL